MNTVARHARACCPFVRTANTSSLRALANQGGLNQMAQKCPVMSFNLNQSRAQSTASAPVENRTEAKPTKDSCCKPFSPSAIFAKKEVVPGSRGTSNATVTTSPYEREYSRALAAKRADKSYRYFNNINRLASEFPRAHPEEEADRVTVWCANDYLGMAGHPHVVKAARETMERYGTGAGGTRNIAGHNRHAVELEETCARLHHKEAALVFSSCFVANDAVLSLLGTQFKDLVYFSDELNHASMIQGIRHSKAKKVLFKHNDMADLEAKLSQFPVEIPKVIAFESVYSMCGSIAPIEAICNLAEKYNALTFLDEVHAVGLYGPHGAGVAEHLDFDHFSSDRALPPANKNRAVLDRIDIITATLGKAYGNVGGYVAGSAQFIDWVRSLAPGFIFTTTLPPAVMAGAKAAIELQSSTNEYRRKQQAHTAYVKEQMAARDIPVIPNPSHIVPVLVGDAELAKAASDMLLEKHNIYVQAINYPTVAVGQERLRITPTPGHGPELCDTLVAAVDDVFNTLNLKRTSQWAAEGGHCGVGTGANVKPIWTPEQLSQ